jgi:hypothetical protein
MMMQIEGLENIKNAIDPRMSMSYFRIHLLPELLDRVIITRGTYRRTNEPKYFCYETQLTTYILKRRKT